MAVRLNPGRRLAERVFSRGIVRDAARDLIPPGGVYDSLDFLPGAPGRLYKRGGWSYQGTTLGSSYRAAWVAPGYTNGPGRVLAVGDDLNAYDVTNNDLIGAVGFGPGGNPTVFPTSGFSSTLVIVDAGGVNSPMKITFDGVNFNLAALGGTPPPGSVSCFHLGRVVIAASSDNPNRVWFSPGPNVEDAWDLSNSYIDVIERVKGLASLSGVLLIFTENSCVRVLGDIPPGNVGENMQLQPVGSIGCIDSRSVASTDSEVIWASFEGVFASNGAEPVSLTAKADGSGISAYWRSLHSDTVYGGVPGGMLTREHYIVTVLGPGDVNGLSTANATLVCHLPTRSWWRVNLNAFHYGSVQSEVLTSRSFAALANEPRIADLTDFFNPSSANGSDADGDAVEPLLETRVLGEDPDLKAYGDGHLTYDLRDAGSDDPTLAVTIATGIEADSGFAAVPESPLTETTAARRKGYTVSKDSQALTVRIAQSGPSAKTELYSLEQDVRGYGPQADGQ